MKPLILIRGGGDIASGVALRLHRTGFQIVIIELAKPLAVRRTVSFCEAVYEGTQIVEGATARLVSADQIQVSLEAGEIPVLIDPNANILSNEFLISPRSTIVIDGRLSKQAPERLAIKPMFYIGLGPGFIPGENCDAAIETHRGHNLGRVLWNEPTQPDTGSPDGESERVLRAPADGTIRGIKRIGDKCNEGDVIAEIETQNGLEKVKSPFPGILRGLIHDGLEVNKGLKIGDVDRRNNPEACFLVSDKALAVGGGALEAVMIKLREFEDAKE